MCEEVKGKLGIKRVRGDTFGYLQRSFVGCVSDVDQREAREVGEMAVQYAVWEGRNGSVAIRRVGDYAVDYPLIPLEDVAGKTRVMEDELINAAGNDVTPAFFDYLRPLLGAFDAHGSSAAPPSSAESGSLKFCGWPRRGRAAGRGEAGFQPLPFDKLRVRAPGFKCFIGRGRAL